MAPRAEVDEEAMSRSTIKTTALWPPDLYAKLLQVVRAETRAEREKAVMKLLKAYTKAMLDDTQKRWLKV